MCAAWSSGGSEDGQGLGEEDVTDFLTVHRPPWVDLAGGGKETLFGGENPIQTLPATRVAQPLEGIVLQITSRERPQLISSQCRDGV